MIRITELSSMKYSLYGLLALLTLVLAITGCSSSPKPVTSNFVVTALDARRVGYTTRWANNLNIDPSQKLTHVTPLGDVIITMEHPSNMVTAIDAGNGSILWRKKWVSDALTLFEPNRQGNQLLINSDRDLYHLDPQTGRQLSVARLEDVVNDGPMVTSTLAVFGSSRGRVFAHDLVSGHSRWVAEMASGINIKPIVAGSHVLAADITGTYAMFSTDSGERLWTGRTFGPILAQPAYSDTHQVAYIPSQDQNLYAVNRSTGKDRWIYRAGEPLVNDLVLLGNTLFVQQARKLVALDASTGQVIWSTPEKYEIVDLIDQRLVVSSGIYLLVLDIANGKTLREVPFLEPVQTVVPAIDDSLIVVTAKGRMVRLDPLR